jgi:hypothetical protein
MNESRMTAKLKLELQASQDCHVQGGARRLLHLIEELELMGSLDRPTRQWAVQAVADALQIDPVACRTGTAAALPVAFSGWLRESLTSDEAGMLRDDPPEASGSEFFLTLPSDTLQALIDRYGQEAEAAALDVFGDVACLATELQLLDIQDIYAYCLAWLAARLITTDASILAAIEQRELTQTQAPGNVDSPARQRL